MNSEAEMNAAAAGETVEIEGFGAAEKDAIGEIQNITMGSAATAVSNLLNAKVWITTPRVSVVKAKDLTYTNLEPSVQVRIEYIKGIKGSSILVLKQSDVQLILNQLMGQPLVVSDDFEFDEMNISAVCEIMNQMMGASATALSELIDTQIDISTPEATVNKEEEKKQFPLSTPEDYVVQIAFHLTIDGIINSEFISILSIDLAKSMAEKMLAGYGKDLDNALNAPKEEAPAQSQPASSGGGGNLSDEEIAKLLGSVNTNPQVAGTQQSPQAPPQGGGGAYPPPPYYPQPGADGAAGGYPPPGYPQQYGYPPQGAPYATPAAGAYPPPYPPQYGYPPQGYPQQVQKAGVGIQPAQFQNFENYEVPYLSQEQNDNLKLLMGVPLNISVEIGSTKRKVKEILEFTQGTIIELERQAGAPVDVIVNGHLIARGDVVVIEDNFAVRITEIVKSRFLDTLGNKE